MHAGQITGSDARHPRLFVAYDCTAAAPRIESAGLLFLAFFSSKTTQKFSSNLVRFRIDFFRIQA